MPKRKQAVAGAKRGERGEKSNADRYGTNATNLQRRVHGALCGGGAFSTHQTSVENVKPSLRRNHVGLRKDYNTIYLEKHNVTLG